VNVGAHDGCSATHWWRDRWSAQRRHTKSTQPFPTSARVPPNDIAKQWFLVGNGATKDDGADMHRRQRQRVLKMSDDAERVTRESGTQISSNTSHIISFQEANCSSDSNTRDANALRNGARNNRSNSASNNQNIKTKYSVHQ
jgi:hypothetical protein